jgi:hypothetical protein
MNPCATIALNFIIRPSAPAIRWLAVLLIAGLACCSANPAVSAENDRSEEGGELSQWQYYQTIDTSPDVDSQWIDFVLGPAVFTHARIDLGDIRVFDNANRTIPYALRILEPTSRREAFAAEEFNRAIGPDQSSELALDLGRSDLEHNEVEIETPGDDFRRRVELEGSTDGENWRSLVETTLIRFQRGDQQIRVDAVSYPMSRYRYLRVRLFPDPAVDRGQVSINSVNVIKRVVVPGELLTLPAKLGKREPVRADGGPGSAWAIDLGGDHTPCSRLEVEIDDAEFARNFRVEALSESDSIPRYWRVAMKEENLWRRRAGEPKKPMIATFDEVRASRLKLIVTDFDNEPLKIRSVKFAASARQIIIDRPAKEVLPVRVFFGSSRAESPNYDFARNLPVRLPTAPARVATGPCEANPDFVPPPLPLTERWPWLIYAVLGVVCAVLAAVIASLARTSITIHDRQMENGAV